MDWSAMLSHSLFTAPSCQKRPSAIHLFYRVARPFSTAPHVGEISHRFERVGRGNEHQLLLLIPAEVSWRAISAVCDPDLGRPLLVGRRLVVSERHPANRVGSCVNGVAKEPGASCLL